MEICVPNGKKVEEIIMADLARPETKRQLCIEETTLHSTFAQSPHGPIFPLDAKTEITLAAPITEKLGRSLFRNGVESFQKEVLGKDMPMMTVQVQRYKDKTMLALELSHVLCDAFGQRDILQAWSDLLHGKTVTPVNLAKLAEDPVGDVVGTKLDSPPPPGFTVLKTLGQKLGVARHLLRDTLITRPEKKIEPRIIVIPEGKMNELQEQAKEDLRAASGEKEVIIGRSTTLFAWLLKNAGVTRKKGLLNPIGIFNMRGRKLAGLDKLEFGTFDNGALLLSFEPISPAEAKTMPVGVLAKRLYNTTQERASPENALATLKFLVQYMIPGEKAKGMPFFNKGTTRWVGLTDTRVTKAGNIDFIPVVMGESGTGRSVAAISLMVSPKNSKRDRFGVAGEFGEQVWAVGALGPKEWRHPDGFGRYTRIN